MYINWKKTMTMTGLFLFFAGISYAQVISFEKLEHDFGTFTRSQTGEGVTCEFVYTNTGTSPLVLNRVVASCGCTTPEWTREPIAAGKQGSIKVTYNAASTGTFSKTITVYSNSKDGMVTLKVKGKAEPYVERVEDAYPVDLGGGILMVKNELNFINVTKDEPKTLVVDFINTNKQDVKISLSKVAKPLRVNLLSEKVRGQSRSSLMITFDAKDSKVWGKQEIYFNMVPAGVTASAKNRIKVTANIIDDISNMSAEQKKNAANLSFSTRNLDLGEMKVNEKKKESLTITNNGKTPLVIHAINTETENMIVKADKNVIAPGKSTKVRITFTPNKKDDLKPQKIAFITNAPNALNAIVEIDILEKR